MLVWSLAAKSKEDGMEDDVKERVAGYHDVGRFRSDCPQHLQSTKVWV
jgi:hypothetical protein